MLTGDACYSAAQSPSMVPMMIQQGYVGIAVAFDYWGLAGMVADGIKNARAQVDGSAEGEKAEGEKAEAVTNGDSDGQGAKATNGTVPVTNGTNGSS